jgi:hypothetical protein
MATITYDADGKIVKIVPDADAEGYALRDLLEDVEARTAAREAAEAAAS